MKQLGAIRIYDSHYRGDCRTERCEQIDSMSWLEVSYPEHFELTFHAPNESRSTMNHRDIRKKEGVKPGVPDIICLMDIVGVFEMKRMDKSQSSISKDQREFLEKSADQGHFVAVCYGFEQFKLAFIDYLNYCVIKRGRLTPPFNEERQDGKAKIPPVYPS